MTRRRNPALVDAAVALHRNGEIDPDTYVIDRDTVAANAAALAEAGRQHDVELWFVAKQVGRNPLLIETVAEHLPLAAAIDVREASVLLGAGARLANVGHLVQIPRRRLHELLAHRPSYVTVYDRANLEAVALAAEDLGVRQPLLLRIAGDPASSYPGQEGGFGVDEIAEALALAASRPGVEVVGATAFPCFTYDATVGAPVGTSTLDRLLDAGSALRSIGVEPRLSMPSHTSVSTIAMIAAHGGAFGEPGHALTGTTPQHAVDPTLAEVPALVYVSEVAQLGRTPSVFGGGFYPRGQARSLVVETRRGPREARLIDDPPENIDYYRRFEWLSDGPAADLGDTAVMSFRTQIFVTRSRVAVVSGLQSGRPVLDGVHDSSGRPV